MAKPAPAEFPISPAVAERWSPYVFADTPVPAEDVRSLLEAARWAPSSFNEQPWRYIVGCKGEEAWQGLYDCLMEPNQAWAQHAPVLMVSVASMHYALNDKPNAHAWHDVGLATGNLLAEATARGLFAHQMGGFFADKVRERFAVPEGFDPVAAIAIGYHGDSEAADPEMAKRDAGERKRRPVGDFAMGNTWGEAPGVLG